MFGKKRVAESFLRLFEDTNLLVENRHAEIEALPEQWQQRIANRVADNVMQLASSNKSWHKASAEYFHNANEESRQQAVDAWWQAGAPIPEIDGFSSLSSDGPAFSAWARSYLGLPQIEGGSR